MNTNLIMGLLTQLIAALTPARDMSSVTNSLVGTNVIQGGIWMTPADTGASPYQGPLAVWTNRTFTLVGGEIPTNSPAAFTDDAIRALAKSGDICRVLGHNWVGRRQGESAAFAFADYHPGTSYRHCSICSTTQSKTEGDWR